MTARRTPRRFRLAAQPLLEDRLAPAVFTAVVNPATDPVGAVAELRSFFGQVNTNLDGFDTVNLFAGGKYEFNTPVELADGGTALPVIDNIFNAVTVNGNGATFYRPPGAPSFRFLRAVGQVDPATVKATPQAPAVGPSLTLRDLTFQGGNVFSYEGGNRIDPDQFTVPSGGAVRTDNAELIATGVTFLNNTATDNGGAVAVNRRLFYGLRGESESFSGATFVGNYAGKVGGAVSSEQTLSNGLIIGRGLEFTDTVFRGNASIAGGGAVDGAVVRANLLRADAIGNRGDTGAVAAAAVSATDTVFRRNASSGGGPGAVLARGNMLTLNRSTVAENTSTKAGAAVGMAIGQAVELINTTVVNNTGADSAVRAPLGQAVLTFSTVADNVSSGTNSGGVRVDNNILTIFGSVIAGNVSGAVTGTNTDVDPLQLVRNDGFNLIGVAPQGFTRGVGDILGSPGKPVEAKLGGLPLLPDVLPLTVVPAATQVRRPRRDSLLLNAGGFPDADRLGVDGRGLPRPANGAADIGAVEAQPGEVLPDAPPPPPPPPPPAVLVATVDPARDNAGAVAELVSLVIDANTNGNPIDTIQLYPGGVYTFDAPSEKFDGGTALPVFETAGQSVTIRGNGAVFFRPPGAQSMRFLRTVNGGNLAVENMTFENGNVFDLEAVARGSVSPAVLNGGAVRVDGGGLFTATQVTFEGNVAGADGGAVAALNAKFFGTRFFANYAGNRGGAVFGGGGDASLSGLVELSDSVVGRTGTVTLLSGFQVDGGNRSVDGTGGVQADKSTVRLVRTLVVANQGKVGGVSGRLVEATDSLFQANAATGAGPSAVLATQNMLRLYRSTLTGNTSARGATAVGQSSGLAVELIDATIHGNTGGAAAVLATADDGEVVANFSTLTNNFSTAGTAAAVFSNVLTTYASVFSGNRIVNADGTFTNTPADVNADIYRNNGFNFVGAAPDDFPLGPTDRAGRNGAEIDPLLGPLAGPTNGSPFGRLPANTLGYAYIPVRLPAAGSPLLNAAGAPLADRLRNITEQELLSLTEPQRSQELRRLLEAVPGQTLPRFGDARGLSRTSGSNADIGAAEFYLGDAAAVYGDVPGDGPVTAAPLPPRGPLPPVVPPTVPPTVPPVSPPGVPPTVPPATAARPPAAFSAGAGAALDPFVAPAVGAAPGARNQKADGSPTAPSAGQTVPGQVFLFNPDGSIKLTAQPFAQVPPGGIRTAVADLTGDGVPDLIAGTGPGVATQVVVVNGATGEVAFTVSPFEGSFTGGVFVAAGDLTGDGVAELVISPDSGGGPRVRVFTGAGATSTALTPLADFFGIDDPSFRGGARVAVGDITGDGRGDLIVAAGTGGGPRVSVWDGTSLVGGRFTTKPFGDFFVFEAGLRDGVYLASGDVDADGRADLIVGAGPGGGPRVLVLSGRDLGTDSPTRVADFFAGDPADRRGVTVAAADLDGDAAADLVAGSNTTGLVTQYLGATLRGTPTAARTADPFGDFQGGVFVG